MTFSSRCFTSFVVNVCTWVYVLFEAQSLCRLTLQCSRLTCRTHTYVMMTYPSICFTCLEMGAIGTEECEEMTRLSRHIDAPGATEQGQSKGGGVFISAGDSRPNVYDTLVQEQDVMQIQKYYPQEWAERGWVEGGTYRQSGWEAETSGEGKDLRYCIKEANMMQLHGCAAP